MPPKKPRLVVPFWNPAGALNKSRVEWTQEFSAASAQLTLEDEDQLPSELEDISLTRPQEVLDVDLDAVKNAPHFGDALKYNPLQPGQIRLFRLEPRDISGTIERHQIPVRGVLEHHYLADRPKYNALSYCWGSNTNPRSICVNGEVFVVHSNLEAALRQLQSYRGDMLLWADRLCINQKDDDEKTLQVQQMKHIYADASLVFAWLGEAADDSHLIMDHFQIIGEDIFQGSRGMLETEAMLNRVLPPYKTPDSRRAISNAFKHFCQRPYWQRLWIIQEFGLAQEVIVICGDRKITMQQLRAGLIFMSNPRGLFERTNALGNANARTEYIDAVIKSYCAAKASFMEGVVTIRTRHWSVENRSQNDFFRVLVTSLALEVDYNHPKSTDPRDRIFATLGLANNAEEFPMLPDYKHDWQFIYTEFAKALLRQGHIDILSFCQFTEINPRLLGNEKLPSWVPDWNLKIKIPCVNVPWSNYFKASTGSSDLQQVQFDENRKRVSLLGVRLDIITSIGNAWDPNWLAPLNKKAAQSYISEVESFCRRSTHFLVTGLELSQVVGRISIADRICCEGSRTWWKDRDVYKNGYCQCYVDTLSAFKKDRWPTEVTYCRRLKFLHSRRPFIAQTGLVGLAPSNIELGDEIWIFLGGKTPYIVSKSVDGASMLRGEAYVQGIMYGEFWKLCANPVIERVVLN